MRRGALYSLLSVRSQRLDSAWHIVDTQYVVVGGVNECHTFLIYKIKQYLPVSTCYLLPHNKWTLTEDPGRLQSIRSQRNRTWLKQLSMHAMTWKINIYNPTVSVDQESGWFWPISHVVTARMSTGAAVSEGLTGAGRSVPAPQNRYNWFFINKFLLEYSDLQCYVSFCCTTKWISYTSTYIHSVLNSFPYGSLQVLSRVPYALQ